MTAGLSPARDGGIFDAITIAQAYTSPGVCTLAGHKREQSLDVKEADGQRGATVTWKGTKVGKFTATFDLVYDPTQDIDDFAAWDLFAEILWSTVPPRSGAKPVAMDIGHPDLERNGYTSVILDTMGEMTYPSPGRGQIAVVLSEYYPPAPASAGSANGSKASREGSDPIDAATAKLNALIEEGKRL